MDRHPQVVIKNAYVRFNLFELIRTFKQEEASTHMTILQLATEGRSCPHKKWCVEMDRRIKMMMQRFEDSTISLTDYLSGLSYLPQTDLLNPLVSLEWSECSEMPLGMSDAQAVLLGGKVYMGGGDIHHGSPATLMIYDFTDNSWDLLNTPTENYALTIFSSQLVLVGGRNPITLNLTDQLCVLDTDQQHWTQPLPSMPIKCCQSSAVSTDHYLIVAGGLDDDLDPLDVVHVYDSYQWRRVEPLPKASYSMKSSLLKGIWYLAGGEEQERGVFCTSLHSLIDYTTSSDRYRQISVWRKLPNVPLEWCTPVSIGKQLAAVGGSSGGHSYSSAIYIYSYRTNAWVYMEDLPVACHSTCTVVLPTGELLAVGGEAKYKTLSCAFRAKMQMTTFPEGQLTMSAIERLKAVAGISIYNQLAPKFLRMAVALHLDPSTIIDLTAENNPVEGSKTMFEVWLTGRSSLPPTWKILLQKLHAIQMEELAEKIEHFFKKPPLTMPSYSLMSENKKVLELDVSVIESKERQSKPDYRDVAIQSCPDCKNSAVQTHSEPTVVATTDFVRGVEIVGETEFTVLDQGGRFKWRGYGMKLYVPKDSFTTSMGVCTLNIRVSLTGHFQLPEDSNFLSPVFWITAPCRFTKPVTLEIQHCALLREDETVLSHLTFASTKCSQRDLPYIFRELDGGVFTIHNPYGSIQLSHFSGIAIIGRKSTARSYCAHLYHTIKQAYDWRYYLVITQDIDAQITAVKYHYDHFAKWDTSLKIVFQNSEITLDIPEDGEVTQEGWKITPMSYPSIARREVDEFRKGRWIPQCELMMEWRKKDDTPVRLQYKIKLNGARAPKNYFQLVLDPTEDVVAERQKYVPSPELKDLMDAFYHTVADKWEHIGIYLHLPLATLKTISEEHQHDPRKCLVEMLGVWLKRLHPPPTWSAIIGAVVFLGEEQLGRKLREKYQL